MRALVVEELAPDYGGCVLKEVETPAPGPGEVRVRVKAAAVNFPDLLQTRGEYQHKPPLPFIPGMEIAGEVELGEHHAEAEASGPGGTKPGGPAAIGEPARRRLGEQVVPLPLKVGDHEVDAAGAV